MVKPCSTSFFSKALKKRLAFLPVEIPRPLSPKNFHASGNSTPKNSHAMAFFPLLRLLFTYCLSNPCFHPAFFDPNPGPSSRALSFKSRTNQCTKLLSALCSLRSFRRALCSSDALPNYQIGSRKPPSARCKTAKRCCAVSKQLHVHTLNLL